jgi:hypothetical protein
VSWVWLDRHVYVMRRIGNERAGVAVGPAEPLHQPADAGSFVDTTTTSIIDKLAMMFSDLDRV